ncbi:MULTISPECIES: hypothetical protein [unclassified Streptomyces]|uniref:hypothetical protein n=1 Tax=unclassified Streptomyces TaxID=2593676 RepID=UPI00224F4B7D|nr:MULTISPECIES: hypothetical protein [unclassified Streptomyces]MCX5061480.1 hypothetical protein [Streptomyces sp. NBC_00452]MCX5292906.1 hypothetical protein [Streptomyces sp. NBC_00183]
MTELPASRPARSDGRPAPSTEEEPPGDQAQHEQAQHEQAQHEQVQYEHAVLRALLTFTGGLAGPSSANPG